MNKNNLLTRSVRDTLALLLWLPLLVSAKDSLQADKLTTVTLQAADIAKLQQQVFSLTERNYPQLKQTQLFQTSLLQGQPEFDLIAAYQAYYFAQLPPHQHSWHRHDVETYQIVSQLFLVDLAGPTVLLSHGYLDHAGFQRPLLAWLLQHGYNVIVFDQPGHGLSSVSVQVLMTLQLMRDVGSYCYFINRCWQNRCM